MSLWIFHVRIVPEADFRISKPACLEESATGDMLSVILLRYVCIAVVWMVNNGPVRLKDRPEKKVTYSTELDLISVTGLNLVMVTQSWTLQAWEDLTKIASRWWETLQLAPCSGAGSVARGFCLDERCRVTLECAGEIVDLVSSGGL